MISQVVIMEPGILTKETAKEFNKMLKEKMSIWVKMQIVVPLVKSLFVKTEDGDERMDYVVTEMMGSGKGQPYQCDGVSMPKNSFKRAGYSLMKKTVMPMMDDPELFDVDLVTGLKSYKGKLLLLSSSCSFIGYDYQEKFNRKYFPEQTRHIKLEKTGHNFITTNPEISVPIIRKFLGENR